MNEISKDNTIYETENFISTIKRIERRIITYSLYR